MFVGVFLVVSWLVLAPKTKFGGFLCVCFLAVFFFCISHGLSTKICKMGVPLLSSKCLFIYLFFVSSSCFVKKVQ